MVAAHPWSNDLSLGHVSCGNLQVVASVGRYRYLDKPRRAEREGVRLIDVLLPRVDLRSRVQAPLLAYGPADSSLVVLGRVHGRIVRQLE